jgi:hypothetical protein
MQIVKGAVSGGSIQFNFAMSQTEQRRTRSAFIYVV